MVTSLEKATPSTQKDKVDRSLQEGDVIIGLNGEAVLHATNMREALGKAARAGNQGSTLTLSVLRLKGKIGLAGASVSVGGVRKQGGYTLQVSNNDSSARRSRHTLVCVDVRCGT